jgi:hypothetical protein
MQADSGLRQAVTAAAHQIDQQLQTDPDEQGESRPKGRRIHFIHPLGLMFRIDKDEGAVSVLHVWDMQRRVQ